MTPRSDGFPARTLVAASVILWALAIGLAAAAPPTPTPNGSAGQPPTATSREASPAPANGFVGDDTCATCHESEAKGLHQTLHGKAQNVKTPAAKTNQSCESCPGPGQVHVDTGDKTKIKRFTAKP